MNNPDAPQQKHRADRQEAAGTHPGADMPAVLFNTETVRWPMTGVGRFAMDLALALRRQAGARIHCIPNDPGHPPEAPRNAGRTIGWLRALGRESPTAYQLVNARRNRRFQRRAQPYAGCVYHEPNYIVRPFDGPVVLTVHDLSIFHYPEYHARASRRFVERNLPSSLDRADMIMVPTDYIAAEVRDLLGVPAERIKAIHHGVAGQFAGPRQCPEALAHALHPYDLQPDSYVLTVGTREPRKNLETTVRAFEGLPADLRRRMPLVVVGPPGWRHSRVEALLLRLQQREEARLLGFVDDTNLRSLYEGARAFVYLSWYEGFGFPPLEAMSRGTPVLTSTAGSLLEVTGDAALHVCPEDPAAATAELHRLLADHELRRRLADAGVRRAGGFTWERTAGAALDLYRTVAKAV